MTNPVAVIRGWNDLHGGSGKKLYLWCPGCDALHGPNIEVHGVQEPVWEWNGSLDRVTISPSLLVYMGTKEAPKNCHSFIRDGYWEFLADSFHHLAGQTVALIPVPDWVTGSDNGSSSSSR